MTDETGMQFRVRYVVQTAVHHYSDFVLDSVTDRYLSEHIVATDSDQPAWLQYSEQPAAAW